MPTINDHLDNLVTLIEATLPAEWSKVYGFRAAPERYKRYAMVSYFGGETQGGLQTGGGSSYTIDFLVVLFAQHGSDETSLEAAERDLNEAEHLIIKTVMEERDNSWNKAIVPYPTIRPRQPRSMPETRLAEIPLRLYTL
jgi:hypothetical protein